MVFANFWNILRINKSSRICNWRYNWWEWKDSILYPIKFLCTDPSTRMVHVKKGKLLDLRNPKTAWPSCCERTHSWLVKKKFPIERVVRWHLRCALVVINWSYDNISKKACQRITAAVEPVWLVSCV